MGYWGCGAMQGDTPYDLRAAYKEDYKGKKAKIAFLKSKLEQPIRDDFPGDLSKFRAAGYILRTKHPKETALLNAAADRLEKALPILEAECPEDQEWWDACRLDVIHWRGGPEPEQLGLFDTIAQKMGV